MEVWVEIGIYMVKIFFPYCSPSFHFLYFSLSFSPLFLSFFFLSSSFLIHIFFSFSSSLLFGYCNFLREEEDNI